MAEQTNLPSIPPPNENNLVAFARAVKEALEVRLGRRGQGLDAMVTFRDLDKVQMVLGDGRGGVAGLKPPAAIGTVGGGYDPTTDTTPPPAPQNVKASGAVRNVILEWGEYPATYRNHAYAEVWRSSTNNLNDAAQIGQSGSTMYVDNVGEGQTRYYWVRFVSQANVTGPWSAAGNAGAQGATSLDVSYTLGLLTSNGFGDPSSQSPFVQLDAPVTINDVEVPAGTYLHQAWVANGTITRLKVGDAAIDDAKVANLSAAKLTAGDGTIGGILKSADYVSGATGWAIHRDGWAEFANATVRGTIYADTGWFKGQIIGGGASTYTDGTGMWTGVDSDTWKFRLGSTDTYLRWDGSSLTLRGTLTIEDGSGNVLLSSGSGVPWDKIDAKPTSLADINSTEGSKLDGVAAGADVTSQNTAAGIANQGAFATLSEINASNVTTYIANAAIGTAQIGNAAITSAKIANATILTANIADGNITSAKIANAAITSAKIGNASVDTLQIAGNAVTIPVGANGTTSATTAAVSFGGAPVIIIASGCGTNANSNHGNATLSIYRNSTLLKTYEIGPAYSSSDAGIPSVYATGSITYIDTPGTGAVTYTVQLVWATNNASCAITAIGARR